MCAILDSNVIHEVFGSERPEAGRRFFEWIHTGNGRRVAGGRLLTELRKDGKFRDWAVQAQRTGRMRILPKVQVNARTYEVKKEGHLSSNDPHAIALAQVSHARLLYSNDVSLHRDFKDKRLVDNPRGKVYSTIRRSDFSNTHMRLLAQRDSCLEKP